MKPFGLTVSGIFLFILFPVIALAQKNVITVTGISETFKIDPSTLNHTTISVIGHDRKLHTYSGVVLAEILTNAGITLGNKKESISSYLIMRAKDNYKAIFSLAEIDPLFSKGEIIVADKIDGNSLGLTDAPFQVIVPGDKIQARWVRQLVSIELVRAK